LAGLEDQVVVTNVLAVKPQEPRRGTKDKGKLKYLIQFTPWELAKDPLLCLSMLTYPVTVMGTLDSRLQQVIASELLKTHTNTPPYLQMMDLSLPSMNVPLHVIGGFILPLSAAVIGGSNSAANRMNAKLVYDALHHLMGKDLRGNHVLPERNGQDVSNYLGTKPFWSTPDSDSSNAQSNQGAKSAAAITFSLCETGLTLRVYFDKVMNITNAEGAFPMMTLVDGGLISH